MRGHIKLSMLLAIAGVLLILAALAGCAPDTSAPVLREEVAQRETTDDPAVAGQTDTGMTGTDPEKTIPRVEFTDQACLDCHTDKARLQELAVEEEEVSESLSSGPG